jgi:catechol 2,3-dioxygenase
MADRPIEPRIEIGRVHLNVADLDRALAFYREALGFAVALRIDSSPVFLTAGGPHHHIVLHAQTEGREALAEVSGFSVRYPHRGALSAVLRRLTEAGVPLEDAQDLGTVEALWVRDPDGHRVELYYERSPAEYPRHASGTPLTAAGPLDLESLRTTAPRPEVTAAGRTPEPAAAMPLSEVTRSRLRDMRVRLLQLHKVLLDDARAAYELDRGHVSSNASLLQLLINDPWFAWLHPLSELVVRIDEVLQPDVPATEADSGVLLDEVARLIAPGGENGRFTERYYEALQRQPAVIMAHAEVRRILKDAR